MSPPHSAADPHPSEKSEAGRGGPAVAEENLELEHADNTAQRVGSQDFGPDVIVTTDGSCQPNPGRGAWAAILRFGSSIRELVGSAETSTNNAMELRAITEALSALTEPSRVLLRTDSRVAIAWCRPASFGTAAKRAKHPHVYPLVLAYRKAAERHQVSFEWVRGHAGDRDNSRADRLARMELARRDAA